MIVRAAKPDDHPGIRVVTEAAFGQPGEADLIEALRADGNVIAEQIAHDGDSVIGHILFSRLSMSESGETPSLAALAPMAVTPERQKQGVGVLLAAAGLADCKAAGIEAVIVLGHPDYYPRFGFSAAKARGLKAPFEGEAFMALELVDGALENARGELIYPAAFGL